jgi:predicted Zn-dependent peptidase
MSPFLALPRLDHEKHTLSNGLDVILRRQGPLPLVAVNLWYHVGSKDESDSQRGFAHLFEHLMFEGSSHYPGNFFEPLQRLGCGVNGSTSTDRTNYYIDAPASRLELALAIESDRMANLLPALTEDKLKVQQGVVTNEYRQNYPDRPYGLAGTILSEALYPAGHPYRWLPIGSMADVNAARLPDIEAFFRRFYVPANASLAVVGAIEPEKVLPLVERYFGAIPGGTRAIRPGVPPVVLDEPIALRQGDRVELERTYEVWPTVPLFDPAEAALALTADVLGQGRSSRLHETLVRETQLAQSVSVGHSARELAGSFSVVVTMRPGQDAAKARELVLLAIDDLAERGPRDDELERVRAGKLAAFLFALDNIGGFGGVADRLNAYNTYAGDPGLVLDDLKRYQAVSGEDIRDAARRFLAGRPSVRLDVVPSRASNPSLPPLDRAVPPPTLAPVPFRAPLPIERELPGGARLWVLPRRDLPLVSAVGLVTAGAADHPANRAGLASLTASMLDEGTTHHSSSAIARVIESVGAHLNTSSGSEGSYASMQCLAPHLPVALAMAAEVLHQPSFPENELNRVRGQTIAAIRADRDSAGSLADHALTLALRGGDDPYGVPTEGTETTVAGLTRADLVAFHRDHYASDRLSWVISGDVDPDELVDRIASFGAPTSAVSVPRAPRSEAARPSSARPGVRVLLVPRPGAAQATIRFGQLGPNRSHPDHTALQLFNHVLGGQFNSRLNKRLREELALTYGIRSHVDARRGTGAFWVGSSLQADRLGQALTEARQAMVSLLDDRPPTSEEMDDAKRALIEGQARQFETPSNLTMRYASLIILGLPMDEHRHAPARVASVTPADALEAGRRHVQPDAMVVVVAADPDRARPALDDLGWAEVEVIEPETL